VLAVVYELTNRHPKTCRAPSGEGVADQCNRRVIGVEDMKVDVGQILSHAVYRLWLWTLSGSGSGRRWLSCLPRSVRGNSAGSSPDRGAG
jgi:hypothetical protein